MLPVSRLSTLAPFVLTLVGLCAGCEKKSEESSAVDPDAAAADAGPQLDPALAKAVASATGDTTPSEAPAADGPPPRGVFEPGVADKQIRAGVVPLLTLGEAGADPKVRLGGTTFKPGSRLRGSVEVAIASDPRQGALPIQFGLTFASSKLTTDAADGAVDVVATVDAATIGGQAAAPQEVVSAVTKLKGSKVSYRVAPNGAGQSFTPTLPKGATPDLEQALRALCDALSIMTLAYPAEPVGAGGFWMITSRDNVMGLDLVSYRMVRVQRVDEGRAVLTVSAKRYAADSEFNLTGLSGDFNLQEFQSTADGTLMVASNQPLPYKGMLKLMLGAVIVPKSQPGQAGQIQIQGQARFDFPTAAPAQETPSTTAPSQP